MRASIGFALTGYGTSLRPLTPHDFDSGSTLARNISLAHRGLQTCPFSTTALRNATPHCCMTTIGKCANVWEPAYAGSYCIRVRTFSSLITSQRGAAVIMSCAPATPCRYIDISDDGSTVAFAGFVNQTVGNKKVLTARVYIFDAQTGALKFLYNLGPSVTPYGGGVQLNGDGSLAAFTNVPQLYVLNVTAKQLVDTITLQYGVEAAISNTGTFITAVGVGVGQIWKAAANGSYALAYTVTPPATNESTSWYPVDMSISTYDPSSPAGELVAYAWIDDQALTVRAPASGASAGRCPSCPVQPMPGRAHRYINYRVAFSFSQLSRI